MNRPTRDFLEEKRFKRLIRSTKVVSMVNSPLLGVRKSIRIIADHLREEETFLVIQNDWKFVAMVVDRCLLWTFILVRKVVHLTISVINRLQRQNANFFFKYSS